MWKMKTTIQKIDNYNAKIMSSIDNSTNEQLQAIVDRPFKPHPYNPNIDFEKIIAELTLIKRTELKRGN